MGRDNRNRRKFSLSEKIFYVLSVLIILSMVLSLVAVAITGDVAF
jgi:cell division protein FtsL